MLKSVNEVRPEASACPPAVLLIEADADTRDMYSAYFSMMGFPVESIAPSHDDDLLLRVPTADVVITGIRMPGLDGVDLVSRIRREESTSAKGIIIVTASTVPHDWQRAHAAGCDAFLVKPCLPQTLAAEVLRVASSRNAQITPGAAFAPSA